jgi:hypothetical protein
MSILHITLLATFVAGVVSGCKPAATGATPTPAPAAQPPTIPEAAASPPPAATSVGAKVAPEPPAPEPPPPPEGMVYVPGGTVYIVPRDTPRQRVQVSPFFIDRTEVTVAAYLKCTKARDCKVPYHQPGCNGTGKKPRLQHPMNCISKLNAERYCRAQGKRLPTTAEWQAAAGGTDGRTYPWGNEAAGEQLCWQRRTNGLEETCPVGAFPQGASPFGVCQRYFDGHSHSASARFERVDAHRVQAIEDGRARGHSSYARSAQACGCQRGLERLALDGASHRLQVLRRGVGQARHGRSWKKASPASLPSVGTTNARSR